MSEPQDTVDRLGLKIRSQFVPFSQSRNRAEKDERGNPRYSLNWKVTLVRVHSADNEAGRDVLTTDYSAGIAHCPSYGKKPPMGWPNHASRWQAEATAWECENGRKAAYFSHSGGFTPARGPAVEPDPLDVLYSLAMDASVLDYASFEQWAPDLGFDPDSRKGEAIYRACLEIALTLRNAIGEAGIEALRNAFQDY